MTLPASFYRAEASYLEPPEAPECLCDDCDCDCYVCLICNPDDEGDSWEDAVREERGLE